MVNIQLEAVAWLKTQSRQNNCTLIAQAINQQKCFCLQLQLNSGFSLGKAADPGNAVSVCMCVCVSGLMWLAQHTEVFTNYRES